MNLYAYARNNPVTRFDPSGMVDEMGTGVVDPLATSGFEDYRLDSPQPGFAMLSAAWWYAMPQEAPGGGGGAAAQANQAAASEATQEKQVELLARLLYAEAGGEGTVGMQAVATVVMNRVASPQFPNTVEKVILQKGQFQGVQSPRWREFDKPPTAQERAVVEEARRIASAALAGTLEYKICGATYFASYGENYSLPPGFFQKAVASGRLVILDYIGNHVFLGPADRR
jgi:spore germination cell wall hydrolase CwlJ-like protein